MRYAYLMLLLFFCKPATAQLEWEGKAGIPGANGRWAAFSFSLNNKIYVGGGYAGNGINKGDFWEYDPIADTWTKKADLPGAASRSGATGFAIGGKGYMAFGSKDLFSQPYLPDLWEYDPAANSWIPKANLPDSGRTHATCFVVNNKAYLVGGATSYSYWNSSDVWEYDPAANQWAAKANYPTSIEYAQAFAIGSYGYVTGGADSGVMHKATYRYDPVADTWTPRADYCDGRSAGVAFVLGNTAYVGLGLSKPAGTTVYNKEFCSYDADADTWTPAQPVIGGGRAYSVAGVAHGKAYAGAGFYYNGAENYMDDWSAFGFPTSVSDVRNTAASFGCYPNPAITALHINTTLTNPAYVLYNMAGQRVLGGTLGVQNTIDISALPAGQYMITLASNEATLRQLVEIAGQ